MRKSGAGQKFPTLLSNPPTPASRPWYSPVLEHMIFARLRVSPPSDGRLGHPLLHMQLKTRVQGVLVSSYCCSSYRVTDPFISLCTFSSSSTGGHLFSPKDDSEHPLLCLPGPGIASEEKAISGSFQENLASVCNGASIWKLIMGWIPGYGNK